MAMTWAKLHSSPVRARGQGRALPQPVEILTPDDIADEVEWLVSDRAKYVTGIQLPVDAGFTVR